MYTYEQAEEACREQSYLVGSQITKGFRILGYIEGVIIAPLDGVNQRRFLKSFRENGDAKRSLKFYQGPLYEVLVAGRSIINSHEVFTITLEKFLDENHLPLHPEAEMLLN